MRIERNVSKMKPKLIGWGLGAKRRSIVAEVGDDGLVFYYIYRKPGSEPIVLADTDPAYGARRAMLWATLSKLENAPADYSEWQRSVEDTFFELNS